MSIYWLVSSCTPLSDHHDTAKIEFDEETARVELNDAEGKYPANLTLSSPAGFLSDTPTESGKDLTSELALQQVGTGQLKDESPHTLVKFNERYPGDIRFHHAGRCAV